MKKSKSILRNLLVVILLMCNYSFGQNVYTVTKTTDPDPFIYSVNPNDPEIVNTLQWAIRSANDAADSSVINFAIPGIGPHIIYLNYELPMITNQVVIDGATQAGYQTGIPAVIVDGQLNNYFGFCFYYNPNCIVEGLYIRNFLNSAIIVSDCIGFEIKNNVINQIDNMLSTTAAIGIRIQWASEVIIQGNIIGTDITNNPNLGNENYGIALIFASNNSNIIGGIGLNEANTVAYNGSRGIWIASGNYNKISGNRIYDNPKGISLIGGGNQNKQKPVITALSPTGVLSGTSQPNDIIEIFGSTAPENANEYLQTVIADGSGNWNTSMSNFNWPYFIATATDSLNNTSEFSNSFLVEMPLTKLIDADCGAINVAFDQVLTADSIPGATQYEFLIENTNIGFSATYISDQNGELPLIEISGLEEGISYDIRVRAIIDNDTANFGPMCTITIFDPFEQDVFVFDRFGNKYSIQDITKSALSPPKQYTCQAGFFNLTFADDGTGTGFDDTIYGPSRRDVACQVFNDLSELISPSLNPCDSSLPVVEIIMQPPYASLTPGALGIASSFYMNIGNSGIIHGEVWKTINGGVNSLYNIGGTHHGYIKINFGFIWHLDLDTIPDINKYDLYSTILHEAIHTLGFASLINNYGNSRITGTSPGYYSRYDEYLRVNGGNYLIHNFDGCYDTKFNADTTDLCSGCPNIIFDGINAGQQYIYTPPTFTSLSHFDNNCPTISSNNFLMYYAGYPGEMDRVPAPEEVQTLCDIGYKITGKFGDDSLFFHTDTLPSCGTIIAGVNDFGPYCSTSRYIVKSCDTLIITDILNNDKNAVQFECLEVLSLNGNVSTTVGNSFEFYPLNPGIVILRYIPIDSIGQRGNFTLVYILVTPCEHECVDPLTCNLICNSEMTPEDSYLSDPHPKAFTTTHTYPCSQQSHIPGWQQSHGTPDYGHINTLFPSPNPGFAIMWCSINHGEGLMTYVPIEQGKEYILSFFRKDHIHPHPNPLASSNILDNLYVILANIDSASTVGIPINLTYMPDTFPPHSQIIYHEENLIDSIWEQVVVCFTANYNYDFIYFQPQQNTGSYVQLWLDQVELIPDTFSAGGNKQVTECGGVTTIGPLVPNCKVTNTEFNWYALGDTIPISNDEYTIVGQGIYILKREIIADTITGNCIVKYDTIRVTEPIQIADAGKDTTLCYGQSAVIGSLIVDSNETFLWSPANGLNDVNIPNPTASPDSTTEYVLTVIDTITGCIDYDTLLITVFKPEADLGPDTSICYGDSIMIGPQIEDSTATYLWVPSTGLNNANIANPLASPDITTEYILTVTDTNICVDYDTVIITVIQITFADFTIDTTCLAAGTPISFQNNSTPATGSTYLWDFGDGSGAQFENPIHQFTAPGYYCVSLTVSNPCGSDTYSETIFILPDECACDYIVNYDIPDGTVISSFTIWDPPTLLTNEITVEGDVIVNSGIELKIKDMIVRFGPKGRIIVKQEGILIIDNSTLTILDTPCENYMWQGIEVWGDASQPSDASVQGQVIFPPWLSKLCVVPISSTIANAHIAILLGKRRMEQICNPIGNEFDVNFSGGVLQTYCNNSNFRDQFINNGIDIKYLAKTNTHASANAINCVDFTCTTLNDAHYNSLTSANPYPNAQNPWAGNANAHQRTDIGIWINYQKGFNITESTFENKQLCIESFDSKYNVYDCDFQQAIYGIRALNIAPNLDNNHEIARCTFDLIPGETGITESAAINIMCGMYNDIHHNEFKNTTWDVNYCMVGIQLDFTTDYRITENIFEYYKKGIIANLNVSGWIGSWLPDWEGNTFYRCERAIETNFLNNDLILKCNDHYPYELQYDVNWNNYGIIWPYYWTLGDQGLPCGSPNCPAGNTFNEQDLNLIRIESNTYYEYRHHGDDDDVANIYRPTTTTAVERIATGDPYTTNIASCSQLIAIPTLPPLSFSVQPYSELVNLNNIKDELQNSLDSLINETDKGETQVLLDAVTGNTPTGKLKNMLIAHSPLSDTVIYTLMDEKALSPGNFKLVMYKNLPVSRTIVLDFYAYIDNFPKGIKNQLKQLQIDNPYAVTPASIRKDIAQNQRKYIQLLDGIIILLVDSNHNRKADAIQLLEYDGSVISKQILYGTYLADGDYSAAAAKLDELAAVQDPMLNNFVELHQILLSLYQQGKTIYDIDSIDMAYVYDLSYQCPPNPAVYNARAIVDLLIGEHVPPCPKGLIPKSMQVSNNDEYFNEERIDNPVLGDNYPDPFTTYTKIPYRLPEGTRGRIIVKDVLGRTILKVDVVSENREIELKTGSWAKGVYLYTLEVNGINIDYRKMLLK